MEEAEIKSITVHDQSGRKKFARLTSEKEKESWTYGMPLSSHVWREASNRKIIVT
jgi:hypothetical protein